MQAAHGLRLMNTTVGAARKEKAPAGAFSAMRVTTGTAPQAGWL